MMIVAAVGVGDAGAQVGEADGRAHASELRARAENERDPRARVIRWEWAAGAYDRLATDETAAVEVRAAAVAAVQAWRAAIEAERALRRPPWGRVRTVGEDDGELRPTPLSAREERLVAACRRYRDRVSQLDDEAVATRFVEANLRLRHTQLAEAFGLLAVIVRDHPEHEVAVYAAHLLIDFNIVAHRYDRVADWVRWFDAHRSFYTARADQDRSNLEERVEEILALMARNFDPPAEVVRSPAARRAHYLACGAEHRRIFREAIAVERGSGSHARLDEVLYEAGVCHAQAGALAETIEDFRELRARFSSSVMAARALPRLGVAYAEAGAHREAARAFEEYARSYPRESDAYRALQDAIFYRRGIGDLDEAEADTELFIARFGSTRPRDAATAFFALALIYERRAGQGGP